MTREDYLKRCHDFDGPIADIARDNPIVRCIADSYCTGMIVTKEEALSQMVVHLSRAYDNFMVNAVAAEMRRPVQPIVVNDG